MPQRFRDRVDAGQQLATMLGEYAGRSDVLVLGLPRGGVPVGFEVAKALGVPLDVFIVRKLGVPGHEELAMGALASGGLVVISDALVHELDIPQRAIAEVIERESRELARRESSYRDDKPFPDIAGQVVILVDDGLATGSTMRAAALALRQRNPARLVVAVPTASPVTLAEFRNLVEETVGAITPDPFYAVGLWYEDFSPTSDAEVKRLLEEAGQWSSSPATDSE